MLSSLPPLTSLPLPSIPFRPRRFVPLTLVAAKKNRFSRLGFRGHGWSGFARRCTDFDADESDFALDQEILEFMRRSDNPDAFPTRKELLDGGRFDLVHAIVEKRDWMSFGWSFDQHEGEEESPSSSAPSFCPYDVDYSLSASSSGRSLEMETNETGIEGILNRLEKERNITFGFDSNLGIDNNHSASDYWNEDLRSKSLSDGTVAGLFKNNSSSSLSPKKDNSSRQLYQNHSLSEVNGLKSPRKPDTWRSWSIQRAGVSNIDSDDVGINGMQTTEISDEPDKRDGPGLQKLEEINHNQIRTRLQHLEIELSTVLHSVRSNPDELVSQKNQESSSDEIQKLTDAWEFQQNEIMNAQDKLRSTRAKIAVFEGKMALALIEAQKLTEQKQKRLDDARRALRLLRSTCIVWPNSASEVLLTGSFDGWASKRKMEKSRTGIFSLWLLLYPGKYEIKFIVDGEWRIDPLRPTVKNHCYENNLLLVT